MLDQLTSGDEVLGLKAFDLDGVEDIFNSQKQFWMEAATGGLFIT